MADRPGDLGGPQPTGARLGAQGPDQGYALTLVTLFDDLCSKKHVDLYFCDKQPRPTVIARYSDEGSDYASGLVHAEANKDLFVAKKLAMMKGLLK